MTSSDILLLALLRVSENEEYEKLDERSIRLELLVEDVLAEDVDVDWGDCATLSALAVLPEWPDAAGGGPTREMPDVPADPIWLMIQLLRLRGTGSRPAGKVWQSTGQWPREAQRLPSADKTRPSITVAAPWEGVRLVRIVSIAPPCRPKCAADRPKGPSL